MAASYPTAVKTFTTKNADDTLQPVDVNDLQDEVNAIEAGLLNGTARLNSSNSTIANLSVSGGSTIATLHVSSGSTFAGDVGCTGTIGSSGSRVKTLWVGQLEASSGAGAAFRGARAFSQSTQTITNATATKVTLAGKTFDPSSHFDSTQSRYIVQTTGYYLCYGAAYWEGSITDVTQQMLYLNGAEVARSLNRAGIVEGHSPVTDLISCPSTGDYIELYVYHNAGANRSISTGSHLTYLTCVRVG